MKTRFSLKTLLLFALSVGAGVSLAMIWQPWQHRFTLRSEGTKLSRIAYSSDGRQLVTQTVMTGQNRTRTTLWNNVGKELYQTDWCASEWDSSAHFCREDRHLELSYATTTDDADNYYQLLDLSTRKMLFSSPVQAVDMRYSSKHRRCCVKLRNSNESSTWVAVYDLDRAESIWEERDLFARTSNRKIGTVAINSAGTNVAIKYDEPLPDGGSVSRFLIANVESGERHTLKWDLPDTVSTFKFSSDGTKLIVIASSTARIYTVATGQTLLEIQNCGHFEFDALSYPERMLLLKDKATFLLKLSGPLPLQPVKLETLPQYRSRICKNWVGWIRDRTLTLRDSENGKTYSTTWIPEHPTESDPHWNMMFVKGVLHIDAYRFPDLHFDPASLTFKQQSERYIESVDRTRAVQKKASQSDIISMPDETPLATIPFAWESRYDVKWSPAGDQFAIIGGNTANLIQRIRADDPGSFLRRLELWITVLLGLGFLHSAFSDWKRFRSKRSA